MADQDLDTQSSNPAGPGEKSTEALKFEDLFDLLEIQRIQDAFADATGVASIITETDGTPITRPSNFCRLCADIIRGTETGLKNCMRSDSFIGAANAVGYTVHRCLSCGLWDGGAAIMVGDRQVASWLVGQVLDEACDIDAVRAYAREIGADQADFDSALGEVTRMPAERFERVCRALELIARQLSSLAFNNVQQARTIAERKKVEEELRASLEERNALYRELKHRVKNSMALMAGLTGLAASQSDNEEVKIVMDDMRTRIESFAVLYDLLGAEGNPDAVRVDSYLARIVDSISDSFIHGDRIGFSLELEPLSIPSRIAAPIGLIVMELTTNSLKYAFPGDRGGTLSVALSRGEGERLRCRVSDDGVGLPPGFDPKKDGGLGMELIGMLVGQLRGIWKIESGPGTRIVLEVPLETPAPGTA